MEIEANICTQRQKLSIVQTFSSVTVFIYAFLQKNNKFVKYCYASLSLVCQACQNAIDTFVKVLRCPVYTNPIFRVYP